MFVFLTVIFLSNLSIECLPMMRWGRDQMDKITDNVKPLFCRPGFLETQLDYIQARDFFNHEGRGVTIPMPDSEAFLYWPCCPTLTSCIA